NAELDLGPMSRASKSWTEERAALHVLEVERERAAVNVSVAEMVEAASDELISRQPQDDFDLLFHVEPPLLDSLPSRPGGLSGPQSSKSMEKMKYSHFFSAPRGVADSRFSSLPPSAPQHARPGAGRAASSQAAAGSPQGRDRSASEGNAGAGSAAAAEHAG